jgi:hypothetical protein
MRLIGHRGPPSSRRCKKLIAELRVHLEQANETIFRLNQLLKAQSTNLYSGIQLTRTQQTVLDILLATSGICTKESLYAALYVSRKGHKPEPPVIREALSLCVRGHKMWQPREQVHDKNKSRI